MALEPLFRPVGLSPSPCLRRVRQLEEAGVTRLPEVVHSHHITGNFDYLLQVEVPDLPAYEDVHANQLAGLPGVATVTSYVTMKTLSADTTA
ncbi:Lrp/AsnC family transcriptional regulator [Streptomyces sp. NPDC093982]|uniref:Lrp/AsnC family transcriptional regulator n=1 Tax=Streptomyces sp. NPDC093982 TaxID=3155077 RepID=UPI0034184263